MKNHYQAMHSTTPLENGYLGMNKGFWLQLYPPDYAQGYPVDDWKFRLSVAPQDVERAWNIVAETLMNDHGRSHIAKVAASSSIEKLSDPAAGQRGKMITIYTNKNTDPAHYMRLCAYLEQQLSAAGIAPGLSVKGDRPVPGSSYLSYRNDRTPDGAYNDAASNRALPAHLQYNPTMSADPYAGFVLDGGGVAPYAAMGAWQPAMTGNGMVARVPVAEAHLQKAMAILQAQGLSAVVHHSETLGSTIRLNGADAAKVLGEQQRFFKKLRPAEWQEAEIANGVPVSRIAVKTEYEASQIMQQLQQQGLNPKVHNSTSMGMTVRLTGSEVAYMKKLREQAENAQGDTVFYTNAQRMNSAAYANTHSPSAVAPTKPSMG